MLGGRNGPPIFDGEAYTHSSRTLLDLRTSLMIRLGFSSQLAPPPPGMVLLLNDFLIDAQKQMYKRYSPLRNLLWWPITVVADERLYDIPSISTGALTDIAFTTGPPDTVTRLTGSFLVDGFLKGMIFTVSDSANNALATYTIATAAALTLTLIASDTVVPESAGASTTLTTVNYQSLDSRRVEEVWVLDSTIWSPMTEGINTNRFNETGSAFPQNYEFRNYLEIWPIPDKAYTIYVKGHFGLLPFADDADITTIDDELVFLMALAGLKLHYGQADAGTYFRQGEVYLGKLVKEKHGNRRYIPNSNEDLVAIPEPTTTFVRG